MPNTASILTILLLAMMGVSNTQAEEGNLGKVDAFTAGLKPIDGKTAAYYCIGQVCKEPVTDPAKLREQLKSSKVKK